MRILAVYPYIPYPLNRGAYYRAYHLLAGLAKDHEVDLLALSEKGEGLEHKDIFKKFCGRVEFVPFQHPEWEKLFPKRIFNTLPSTIAHWTLPEVEAAIDQMLASRKYDAVHVFDIVLMQYFMKKHTDIPAVVDRTRVDLYYQRMEHKRLNFSFKNRLLNYENYAKLALFEKAVAKRCKAEVVCGPDDKDVVLNEVSSSCPIEVIPNGVELEYFHPNAAEGVRSARHTLLFCGAMDYNPNVDALRWYFQEIHAGLKQRIPDLEILIVGKDPIAEIKAYASHPGVTVTGGVPDVRPYYKKAWLQMVPLRIGGGTRLKIVESLAMGTPVVSTTIGAQGLDLVHDHDILLADTAESFIEQTARGLQNPELRANLEKNGLVTVKERLSWHRLGKQLSDFYSRLFNIAPSTKPTVASAELSLA
ncbi:MAG: glycosyltransferase family 4 protein [Verrucomicrobiales bacterium]